jgi:hypothetical protein
MEGLGAIVREDSQLFTRTHPWGNLAALKCTNVHAVGLIDRVCERAVAEKDLLQLVNSDCPNVRPIAWPIAMRVREPGDHFGCSEIGRFRSACGKELEEEAMRFTPANDLVGLAGCEPQVLLD